MAASAGEPLNPEIIETIRAALDIEIRDGYGQTETTAQIANTPGQRVVPGSMGRPLPGYRVALLDAEDRETAEGEVALDLRASPLGLMLGYEEEARLISAARGGNTAPAMSRSATRRAISPILGVPMTCSRLPTTASAPSSSKAP